MKTYNLIYALLACIIIGCSKSENGTGTGDDNPVIDADYNLLVSKDGLLSSTLINATSEITTLNPAKSPFEEMATPNLIYKDGAVLTSYHKDSDCSGTLSQFNFADNSSSKYDLFKDFTDCDLTVTAIAHSNTKFFLTYHIDSSSEYFIRTIDPSTTESNFVDIPLRAVPSDPTFIPKELVFANQKLFVLGHDEDISNEYNIMVMNPSTNNLIHELELGFNVKQIFRNHNDNVIISYNNLHTELDSDTMVETYINYETNTAPNFTSSKFNSFDDGGRMYYEMPPGDFSSYAIIPAVYDFEGRLAILYAYENFLSEAQRNFEYKIESTTMVGYDAKNDYILIGYKKLDSENKGGLMRIKPAPEPALIDNLDVDGLPYMLFVD